jgi:hypothetical protein
MTGLVKRLGSMETKWGQAILGLRNRLRLHALLAQSLQSIMGATLTFLCVFRVFAAIQKVIYKGVSAVLLRIVTRDQH